MKKLFFIALLAVGCFAQATDSTDESLDAEKRVIEAERKALEAEKRALEAERRVLDIEKKSAETERTAPNTEKQQSVIPNEAVHNKSGETYTPPEPRIYIKPSGSVELGLGWHYTKFDDIKSPFDGVDLTAGFGMFFPVGGDFLWLGGGIGIGYLSVSANGNGYYDGYRYTEKVTFSSTAFGLLPEIRVGEITKCVGIRLGISLPMSSKMTQKISFPALNINDTEKYDLDLETSYRLGISARYDYIGAGISIPFDSDDSWSLGASLYLPLEIIARGIEIVPSFVYWFSDGGTEFSLSIGLLYSF